MCVDRAQFILAILDEADGIQSVLAQSMCEPIKASLTYEGIGRKILGLSAYGPNYRDNILPQPDLILPQYFQDMLVNRILSVNRIGNIHKYHRYDWNFDAFKTE